MAAEYGVIIPQTIAPNGSMLFTESPVPCNRGYIFHRDGSGLFRLASPSVTGCNYRIGCGRMPSADYTVGFHARVQIPEGGTIDTITFAVFVDGEEDPASLTSITPAAVEEPGTIGTDIVVEVPWICRCSSVSVRNISPETVEVLNGVIVFDFAGIRR